MTSSAVDPIQQLVQRGALSPLDRHFALTLGRLTGEESRAVLLGAALASRAVQRGHVCVDLARLHDVPLLDADDQPITDIELPSVDAWCAALAESPAVATGDELAPLVLERPGRLYLHRYARYQARLAERLAARLRDAVDVDADVLHEGLDRLFPSGDTAEPDLQREAALVALQRRFTVISGGPGTGKTSTVVKILALLQEQARAAGREELRIQLLAPTGKAAQRLGESIQQQVERLACDPVIVAAIPKTASTIHRALGFQPHTPTRFRHDAQHPLPADVVLVDEASMVDLALMAKLADAVLPDARFILLGDRDQLASVEAGAIFGDICGEHGESHEGVVHLTRSYRYTAESGIGVLARAINAGDADAAIAALRDGGGDGAVALVALDRPEQLVEELAPLVRDGFGGLGRGDAAAKLAELEGFRILCAHRRGPLGAEEVNPMVEEWLHRAGLLRSVGEWYDGRPVMVVRNDYQLDLFNGDVGVIAMDPATDQPRAWFAAADGLRSLPPARLPQHETVFATTVHKSQGSEFDHVAIVLPAETSPVLTRELLYTGITRARRKVTVIGSEAVLRDAIRRRIERASGLREALWGSAAD